jgi:ABC-type glycerol-3-phosphate transport system permease component
MDINPVKNIAAPGAPVGKLDASPARLGGRESMPAGRGQRAEMIVGNTIAYVLLLLGAALFALPFLFLLGTALKSVDEVNEFPPRILPMRPSVVSVDGKSYPLGRLRDGTFVAVTTDRKDTRQLVRVLDARKIPTGEERYVAIADVTPVKHFGVHLENFRKSLTQEGMPFGRFFLNSLLIVVSTVAGATMSAALCAYGFARLRFRGRDPLFLLLLSTMMIPGQVTMIPVYIMFKELHWINTYLPLIVPAWFGGGAFSIFLLRQFFQSIPFEMEEAARIDGAGPLGTWWRIILPLSLPALATVAIFTFMGGWNDFMGPLIYLNDTDKFTLALGLNLFKGQYGTDTPHLMMAATLVVLAPVLLLFFFAQKHFIQGIVVSGVKG